MIIGDAADATGLPVKTIRYYESIGLVAPARTATGYRVFSDADLHALRFVARARSLGFSVEDCRRLLSLYADRSRASADVRSLATDHIAELDRKMTELAEMRRTLATLVDACQGDERPDCPILDRLAD